MNLPSNLSQVTVPALSEAQRRELLDELVEIALTIANAQTDILTSRIADAMQRTAAQAGTAKEADLRANAARLLKQTRYPRQMLFQRYMRHKWKLR